MSRFSDAATESAIDRGLDDARGRVLAEGPVLEVHFPVANVPRDVAHGLDVRPTGYQLILEVGGHVRATNVTDWTPEIAFLQADANNTRARLWFVLTEDPIDA